MDGLDYSVRQRFGVMFLFDAIGGLREARIVVLTVDYTIYRRLGFRMVEGNQRSSAFIMIIELSIEA